MDEEEDRKKPKLLEKPDFESFSIEALNDYIGELKSEIARAESAIAGKNDARKSADAFF